MGKSLLCEFDHPKRYICCFLSLHMVICMVSAKVLRRPSPRKAQDSVQQPEKNRLAGLDK